MAEFIVGSGVFLASDILLALLERPSKENLHEKIERCRDWLIALESCLKDSEGSEAVNKDMRVVRLAYDIKEILDISLLHLQHQDHEHVLFNKVHNVAHHARHFRELYDLSSKMTYVERKFKILQETGIFNRHSCSSSTNQPEVMYALEDGDSEICKEPTKTLADQLMSEESRCLSIAVVGPGGSGKTTLAEHVFRELRCHFDCHALVNVSKEFSDQRLFISNMLARFCESSGKPVPEGSGDEEKLANFLRGKRYVVILDDLRSKVHWDFIKNVLGYGDNSCRSRIVVTTRNSDVGSYCADPGSGSVKYIHDLSCGLSGAQAWSLFCRIAYRAQRGECPPELEEWSQKIVKRCEGLPFAIVAVGSVLSGLDKQLDSKELKNIHDNLGSKIRTSADFSNIRNMMSSCYQGVPTEKKICLLYLSLFPEDCSVKRGRLIRLWSAEGLVKRVDEKTHEEMAAEYLDELVAQNLVHVSRRDCRGHTTCCRLQNLMLEFTAHIAEEGTFVHVVSQEKSRPSEKVRRLSVQDSRTTLSKCWDIKSVRSAIFFTWDKELKLLEDTLRNCNSLSVLDLEGAPLENFPNDIVRLKLLKYLSLRDTKIKVIPKSIKKLSLLQTLDLRQTFVVELPTDINKLHYLRHLFVYRRDVSAAVPFDSFVIGMKMFTGISNLRDLQKLAFVKIGKNDSYVKELEALTQLRKLGIILEDQEDGRGLWLAIHKMAHLSTLDVSTSGKEDYLALEFPYASPPPQSLECLYLNGRMKKRPEWICSSLLA